MRHVFAVVAALFTGVLPQADAQATPQLCMGTFVGMNFHFTNYGAYTDYFHNESKMQLAQAGVYTGPEAIEEYVKFATEENPAFQTVTLMNHTFALTGIVDETCEFFTIQYSHYQFNEIFSNGTLNVVAAFRMYLNTTSGKMDRINVFYETPYLHWFGSLTAFPKFQAWVCDSMESGCPDTWSFNGLSSQSECISRLAALPTATGDTASFDGNSQSCRALHGMLAGLNPEKHCPHISFVAQEDPSGAIKCQTSQAVQASELFTTSQMALLGVFKTENGIPVSGYIGEIPCDSDDVICPLDQVCVEGVCAESNTTNTTDDGNTDDGNTDEGNTDDGNLTNTTDNTTTSAEHVVDSAAYNMRVSAAGVLLLAAAWGSTPL